MKTIQPGKTNPNEPKPPIWLGVRFTCRVCNAQHELEAEDEVSIMRQERMPDGLVTIRPPRCPNCRSDNPIEFRPSLKHSPQPAHPSNREAL
jgi:hypothetical protein